MTTGAPRVLAAIALLLVGQRASADDARRTQEILFPEIAAHTLGDAPFGLSAKATSGLPVAFEVVSGPATLDGRTLTLGDAQGLVILRASQEGNALFQPARPAERAFALNARPTAPRFLSGPSGASVEIGGTLVLSVTASGEPSPALQWRKDGRALEGARDRTLTISTATLADAGTYDVAASNALGAATSPGARVAVGKRHQSISFRGAAPAVAGQPVTLGADASSGLPVTFEVVAGTATLNGTSLTGQAGTVVVRASQPGNAEYEAAAAVTQTFTISPAQSGPHYP